MILSLRFVLSCAVSNGVFLCYCVQLLGRVFNILRENNPELAGDRRRTVMRPPQVLREGTKKTVFANFMDLCRTYVWFLLLSTLPVLWALNYLWLLFSCILLYYRHASCWLYLNLFLIHPLNNLFHSFCFHWCSCFSAWCMWRSCSGKDLIVIVYIHFTVPTCTICCLPSTDIAQVFFAHRLYLEHFSGASNFSTEIVAWVYQMTCSLLVVVVFYNALKKNTNTLLFLLFFSPLKK